MNNKSTSLAAIAGATVSILFLSTGDALAQDSERGPFFYSLEGLYSNQTSTDLEDGGSFSVDRAFVQAGTSYQLGGGNFLGLSFSYGQQNYNFDVDGPQPWDRIQDLSFSAVYRGSTGDVSWLVAPTLRYAYEDGASMSDGETLGVFAGVSWRLSDSLTIGPAFGAFSEIGEDGPSIFPALLVDWDITDRISLSTGPTIGASRGPGLTLSYAATDSVNFGLTGRYESQRFALDNEGIAPGGVGEDENIPVVLSVGYAPNPGFAINAFAGAEFGGSLRLEDQSGAVVSEQTYGTAPIFGVQARLAF